MSGKPVEFHPEALAEAEAAAAWYRERSLQAAEAFVRELEDAVSAIRAAPERWPRVKTLPCRCQWQACCGTV
ncbi:MAG: type II toxin-antitoxin system RelE/ParE family toxin [Terriglobia bacterium]